VWDLGERWYPEVETIPLRQARPPVVELDDKRAVLCGQRAYCAVDLDRQLRERWKIARDVARDIRRLLDQRGEILTRLGEAVPTGDTPEAIFARARQAAIRRILAAEPGIDPASLDYGATLQALVQHLAAQGIPTTPQELARLWENELAGNETLPGVQQAMTDVVRRRTGTAYATTYEVRDIEDGRALQRVWTVFGDIPRDRASRMTRAGVLRTETETGQYGQAAAKAKAYADGLAARADQLQAMSGDAATLAATGLTGVSVGVCGGVRIVCHVRWR